MQLYAILRRDGWQTPEDLQAAAARSTAEGDKRDDVRWIRSYVLGEDNGTVGTVCLYEASSPEAIRSHAAAADLPVTEIIAVADTVIVRPDPLPSQAEREYPRPMPRYVIERDFGLVGDDEMLEIAALSKTTIIEGFPDITWEHSHVVSDDDGAIKTFCIYEGPNEDRVREHAARLGRHAVAHIYEIAGDITPDEIKV